MLTQQKLKELFTYNPLTGFFTRNQTSFGRPAGSYIGTPGGPKGHLSVKIDGTSYYLHRLAFLYMEGYIPDFVDHINVNPQDNRWDNLRPTNRVANNQNLQIKSTNTTGYPGVSQRKGTSDYFASLIVNGKKLNLGRFHTFEEAARARYAAENQYGVHQNHSARSLIDTFNLVQDLL